MTKKYERVEDLPGVGEKIAEKLKKNGYLDLMALAAASPKELIEVAELGEETAAKIINIARESLDIGYETGTKVAERKAKQIKITTGSKNLDELVGGGIETSATVEAHGAFSSGKSQLAHQLAVNVQLSRENGGADGACLFIDTENTFSPNRIEKMALAVGLDPHVALENIFVGRAYNADHQCLLIENAGKIIREKNIKLIVVDSVTALFRTDYSGRGELAPRQQKLNGHLHALQRLADIYGVAVYITNQVMSRPDVMFGDPTVPIGGHIMGHFCVAPDTFVQLADGEIKDIKNMSLYSPVSGFDLYGKLDAVNGRCSNVHLNTNPSYLCEIETSSSVLKATPQHGIFINRGFDIYEIPAGDVKPGDFIAAPKTIDIEGAIQSLPAIKIPVLVQLSKTQSSTIKKAMEKRGIIRKRKIDGCAITPRQLRRVLNQGYPTPRDNIEGLVKLLKMPKSFADDLRPIETNKHRLLNMPSVLDADLAACLGYFLGDGNLEISSLRLREERLDVIEHYKEKFDGIFGLDCRISKVKDKNCWSLSVNSAHIRALFKLLSEHYLELISKSPRNVIAAFIRGFVDAEGYVSQNGSLLTAGQMNRSILEAIRLLLLRFGIRSRVRKAHIGWLMTVGGPSLKTYRDEIGVTANSKKKRLLKYNPAFRKNTDDIIPVRKKDIAALIRSVGGLPSHMLKHREVRYVGRRELRRVLERLDGKKVSGEAFVKLEKLRYLVQSNLGWQKVKRIKTMKALEPLYDLSVPNVENFIANGVLVHNSTVRVYLRKSKGPNRIARMIDAPHLPENECIFTISENGLGDPEEKE